MTSKSGIMEHVTPITHARFGASDRYIQALIGKAATPWEKAEAIVVSILSKMVRRFHFRTGTWTYSHLTGHVPS